MTPCGDSCRAVMDVILRMSPDVSTSPNLPRSPIILVTNQMGRAPTAGSGSVMRVHAIVLSLFRAQQNNSCAEGRSAEVLFRTVRQPEAVSQISKRMRQK